MNSVPSPGVRADVGAVVRDLDRDTDWIRAGAVVDRAILDKEVVVGQGAIVGEGLYDGPPNRQEPGRLHGHTVFGKQSCRAARLGRNVKVGGGVSIAATRRRPQTVRTMDATRPRGPGGSPREVASAG